MLRLDHEFQWHTSSRSNGGGECVEVALNVPGISAIRDSKDPNGPVLAVTPRQFAAFTAMLKANRLDP